MRCLRELVVRVRRSEAHWCDSEIDPPSPRIGGRVQHGLTEDEGVAEVALRGESVVDHAGDRGLCLSAVRGGGCCPPDGAAPAVGVSDGRGGEANRRAELVGGNMLFETR